MLPVGCGKEMGEEAVETAGQSHGTDGPGLGLGFEKVRTPKTGVAVYPQTEPGLIGETTWESACGSTWAQRTHSR